MVLHVPGMFLKNDYFSLNSCFTLDEYHLFFLKFIFLKCVYLKVPSVHNQKCWLWMNWSFTLHLIRCIMYDSQTRNLLSCSNLLYFPPGMPRQVHALMVFFYFVAGGMRTVWWVKQRILCHMHRNDSRLQDFQIVHPC